jgi:hypothetical protein
MSLATSDESGVGIRTVLLKTFDEQGFVFFTNYNSKKSKQINNYFYFNSERGSDCCLRPTQTFFSYNVARTS